ncbi:uncharacterized protein J3D65DRAFT_634371 [Phyllosticta citribraziliensis]|uniref:Uncharacterized protein n=1 Tax=Phyllosticta citribraziliensis TaxID=989973 RepID=A0ABR1LEL1_9PEZI
MVSKVFIAGLLASQAASNPLDLSPRHATCGKNMQVCSPSGATTSHLPSLGPDLSSLYVDLLSTVEGVHFAKRHSKDDDDDDDNDDDTVAFCCSAATSCLLLSSTSCPGKIPICYDKYTTNFVLPDGTTGTIAAGTLNLPDGSNADLFSGAYTNASSHVSGNLYVSSSSSSGDSSSSSHSTSHHDAAADKPNTTTLSIPPVYTAAGVGSAIPISALGTLVTSVVSSVETLVSQATLPPTTRAAAETDAAGSTLAPATTRPAATVVPTTILSTHVSTVVTEEAFTTGTAGSSASPTPSGFTGAAGAGRAALVAEARGCVVAVVLGAAMLLGGVAGVW